jgi:tetratricopeptide (TPR) repeat protein
VLVFSLAPPSLAQDSTADGSFEQGSDLLRARDYAAAVEALERAVAEAPEHVEAWFKLGLARAALQDSAGAIEAYGRVTELDPTHAKAHNNVANVYYRQGKYEEAAVWYLRSLEIDPDYLLALFHHGWILRHLGREEEAEQQFTHCLELQAEGPRQQMTQMDCLYYLGALRFRAGEYDRTAAIMERVIAARPGHIEARYYLAMSYRRLGRTEEAKQQLEIHRQMLRAARSSEPVEKQREP